MRQHDRMQQGHAVASGARLHQLQQVALAVNRQLVLQPAHRLCSQPLHGHKGVAREGLGLGLGCLGMRVCG